MLSVEQARDKVLESAKPVGQERAFLGVAAGRVLAEELRSLRDLPPADNSAMDGYGLRAADVDGASADKPVKLEVIGEKLAGGGAVSAVPAKRAVRIMTGARIPDGVDAVVMRENTDESGVQLDGTGRVAVKQSPRVGENIRRRGEDVAKGDVVGAPGDVLTPGRVNLLASAGHVTALVYRRPRVAILASGDELRELGEPYGDDDILNSNAHAIAAAVALAGGIPELAGIARDTLDDHKARIAAAAGADVLVTIGGVSAGTHDFVRPAFEAVGVTLELWKVAMRPGKPLAFGRRGETLVFGLPGNPVSSVVGFELFVRPALLRMQGRARATRTTVKATLTGAGTQKKPGFAMFARGRAQLDGGAFTVALDEKQGSAHLSGMARANALVVLGSESTGAEPGELVDVMLLDDDVSLA